MIMKKKPAAKAPKKASRPQAIAARPKRQPSGKAHKKTTLPQAITAQPTGTALKTGDLYRTRKDNAIVPIVPPPVLPEHTRSQIAPHVREAIMAKASALRAQAANEVLTIQVAGFAPPAHKIIDYDFALLVFAEAWLGLPKTDTGSAPAFQDIRSDLPDLFRTNAAKACLMSLKGEPWTPRSEWPDDQDVENARWTASRCRHLHRAGLLHMPENFHEGVRSYRALLTTRGLVRAIWIMNRLPKAVVRHASPTLLGLIGE